MAQQANGEIRRSVCKAEFDFAVTDSFQHLVLTDQSKCIKSTNYNGVYI